MAILDQERGAIVLRIVYDGPAGAGKTTSVRALGRSYGRPVITPEEAGERTLFFDWLEYTGGLFEGYPLRCQVISVPGQALLARRRRAIIGAADAVVYVSPVTSDGLAETVSNVESVHGLLSMSPSEPVGMILQANKRDLPSSAPIADIRTALEDVGLRIGIVESTATSGTGIREAFVLAVRLALDRVGEQIRLGTLKKGRPEIESADDLHRQMRAAEIDRSSELTSGVASRARSPIAELVGGVVTPEAPVVRATGEIPIGPDERVMSGMVWPPIEGRLVLREATTDPMQIGRVRGGFAGDSSTYRLHSPTDSVFADEDAGRAQLLRWARFHAEHASLLSTPRCIALASDGMGGLRLWQIVRSRPSIRERLATILDEHDDDALAASLIDAASRLASLHERVRRDGLGLRVTLDTAGVVAGETQYVGLAPEAPMPNELRASDVVKGELSVIVQDFQARSVGVTAALRRAHASAPSDVTRSVLSLFGDPR